MATELQDTKAPTESAPRLNVPGLVGLILSLIGLGPLGLIVSLYGLRRRPRGLAIAGTVVGALTTLITVAAIVLVGSQLRAILSGEKAEEPPLFVTQQALKDAAARIDDHHAEHGTYPDQETGDRLVGSIQDAWNNPLRYSAQANGYTIVSSGGDRQFGTADDVNSTQSEAMEAENLDLDIDLGL